MALWSDLFGVFNDFVIGGFSGARLKGSTGHILVRSAGDSADANLTAGTLKANDPDVILDADGNALTISRNSGQAGALQIIWPPAKGTNGQVLAQKSGTAAGVIEFELIAAVNTAYLEARDTTSLAFGSSSPVTMFTLPINAIVDRVTVIVDTAFNGAPSISVGIAGTTSKYVASTQVDLTKAAKTRFDINPAEQASGSTEALIITYAAGGASVGAARVDVIYSVPQ